MHFDSCLVFFVFHKKVTVHFALFLALFVVHKKVTVRFDSSSLYCVIPPRKTQQVTAVAFAPNHYRMAVATVDRYILLYDEDGELRDRFPTKPAEKTTGPKVWRVRV